MSGLFKINLRDFINGGIMAVGGAVFTFLQQFVIAGSFSLDAVNWRLVGGVALGALVTYLFKNFFTDNSGKTLGIEATKPPATPPPAYDHFTSIALPPPTPTATTPPLPMIYSQSADESQALLDFYKWRQQQFHKPPTPQSGGSS